jgi:RNA polymerase sigma factor (sigma-70 family)
MSRAIHSDPANKEGEGTLDRGSYEDIYRTYLPDVLRLLRGGLRIKSAFDVEEICQEAFIEFFDQCDRGNFDRSRPIKPYLLRIAANRAARKMGKASREVLVGDDQLPLEPVGPPDTDEHERARLLEEFRGTLSKEDNGVLHHHFVEGATQQKTGEALGLSRDQVYRAIQRIRQLAKTFFGERGWFE